MDGAGIVARPSLHLKVGCLELWCLNLCNVIAVIIIAAAIIRIFPNHHHISHCHLEGEIIIKNLILQEYCYGRWQH